MTKIKAQVLTPKQKMFCQEYLVDLNATQAAKRAGYSVKTARSIAATMLSKVYIQEEISKVSAKRVESVQIDAKYVLNRLHEIDCLDVIDIVDESGSLKAIKDWPKAWRISISGLDINEMLCGEIEIVVKKIKWPDKLRNLELLGKHIDVGAWEKETDTGPTVNYNIMPVPTADNIDSWEAQAQKQQDDILNDA